MERLPDEREGETINQEYKLDGKIDKNPIGAPTKVIEGNFLNIVIKEQYLKQLNDCFEQADIEIADSFCAARMDADIILSNDARRNGCALVNLGAETTTIAIFNNDMMRKLVVLPLGSNNITMDICSAQISRDEAEEIKITRGYKSSNNEIGALNADTLNTIINARMNEILQNVKYQIEESNENIVHIIFTGGGSKLKNLEMLFEEYLPNFKCEIISEPQFNLVSNSGVNINGVFSTALYSLLKLGNENCCEELKPTVYTPPVEQKIFTDDLFDNIEEEDNDNNTPKESDEKKVRKPRETKQKATNGGWMNSLFGKFGEATKSLVKEMTSDDGGDDNDDN